MKNFQNYLQFSVQTHPKLERIATYKILYGDRYVLKHMIKEILVPVNCMPKVTTIQYSGITLSYTIEKIN